MTMFDTITYWSMMALIFLILGVIIWVLRGNTSAIIAILQTMLEQVDDRIKKIDKKLEELQKEREDIIDDIKNTLS